MANSSQLLIYQSQDGAIKLDVHLEEETVWLSQAQMASLFGKGRSTITEHISNIFKEGELDPEVVCRDFRHTTLHGAIEGKTQVSEVSRWSHSEIKYRVHSF